MHRRLIKSVMSSGHSIEILTILLAAEYNVGLFSFSVGQPLLWRNMLRIFPNIFSQKREKNFYYGL